MYDLVAEEGKDVSEWRARMIKQFEDEGRGSMYVRHGDLVKRRLPLLFSPNYPCYDGYVPFYIPH